MFWWPVLYVRPRIGDRAPDRRPLIRLNIDKQAVAADFRFTSVSYVFVEEAEVIALYGGVEAQERSIALVRFRTL